MTFDESVLEDEAALERRDSGRLLWSLATAGAQVRRAGETVADFGVQRLRDAALPRALLVAGDSGPSAVTGPVVRLAAARTPALAWHGVELPRWAGPADAMLIGTVDGHDPRLATLAEQAVQRGLALAVAAPAASPVAAAAGGRAPFAELPRGLDRRAARWSALTPLLQALDVLGVDTVPTGLLAEIADALDQQAELCRPGGEAFTNPAKSLAVEFAAAQPVVAGAGSLAGAAAAIIAESLQQVAGCPAMWVALPEDVARAEAVLRAAPGAAEEDFFRDRVDDEPERRPRLLVVGADGAPDDPLLGEQSELHIRLDENAARHAARALHELAAALGLRSSSVDVPGGDPRARFAAATAFGDFTAAYLALGLGTAATP